MKLHSSDLKFTFTKLNEEEKKRNISYIRKTIPDYILEIQNLNVTVEIMGNDGKKEVTRFPDNLDCCFLLNYGDLFLCALEVAERSNDLVNYCIWLFGEALKMRKKCDCHIDNILKTQKGNHTNGSDIILLEREYKKHLNALAFAVFIANTIIENDNLNEMFSENLSLALLGGNTNPVSITVQELQNNLVKHDLFSEVTLTVRYLENGEEEYSFTSLYDLIGFELRQIPKKTCAIKRCENCGRLFIPSKKADEKYCDYLFDGFKTCKESAFTVRLNKDIALNTYRKIYKTQNARKQRNSHIPDISNRFILWHESAKRYLTQCQNGEITLDEMIECISSDEWMHLSKK